MNISSSLLGANSLPDSLFVSFMFYQSILSRNTLDNSGTMFFKAFKGCILTKPLSIPGMKYSSSFPCVGVRARNQWRFHRFQVELASEER